MIDMLTLRTDLKINEAFVAEQLSSNPRFTYQKYVRNFEKLYYLKFSKDIPSPFKWFTGKSRHAVDRLIHTVEINPNHFRSVFNLHRLLEQFFIGFSPERFRVSRLDFAVDVEIPFETVLQQVYRKKIQQHLAFVSKGGAISGVVLGKRPVEAKVYNKTLEQAGKKRRKDVSEAPITRFEVKLLRRSNNKFPIETLSELDQLLDYDPFQLYRFKKVKVRDIEPITIESLRSAFIVHTAKDQAFGGMHQALRASRRHFDLLNQRQVLRYFEDIEPPELYPVYRRHLERFLSLSSYEEHDIGGILV
ncbi:MAG: hypothetical protein A2X94_13580 [Bdellovibrionales bacterium GWB1_55_8]|nr:MAG: hypothetical protein A2X94_13580 [Bdellovibrionales bacterium GWB1_55_8]